MTRCRRTQEIEKPVKKYGPMEYPPVKQKSDWTVILAVIVGFGFMCYLSYMTVR